LGPGGIIDLTICEELIKHQKEEKVYNNNKVANTMWM
jgi:hypothetical protein